MYNFKFCEGSSQALPSTVHRNSYPGTMLPGMTFTIEPGVSEGGAGVAVLGDGWTAVSPDHSRSAQFEHTVLVTDTGVDILTLDTDSC